MSKLPCRRAQSTWYHSLKVERVRLPCQPLKTTALLACYRFYGNLTVSSFCPEPLNMTPQLQSQLETFAAACLFHMATAFPWLLLVSAGTVAMRNVVSICMQMGQRLSVATLMDTECLG